MIAQHASAVLVRGRYADAIAIGYGPGTLVTPVADRIRTAAGKDFTDTGDVHEHRGLKGRPRQAAAASNSQRADPARPRRDVRSICSPRHRRRRLSVRSENGAPVSRRPTGAAARRETWP